MSATGTAVSASCGKNSRIYGLLYLLRSEAATVVKHYVSPKRDGFYGAYYPNPVSSSKAMIAMLGDSSDDHMAKSGVRWLYGWVAMLMAMSPGRKDYGHHNYPLERIETAIAYLKAVGNEKIGMVGAPTTQNTGSVSWQRAGPTATRLPAAPCSRNRSGCTLSGRKNGSVMKGSRRSLHFCPTELCVHFT